MKKYKYLNTQLCKSIIADIKEIYSTYLSGGALHIVLDDGNVEDRNIKWCINESINKDFEYYYNEDSNNTLEQDRQLFLRCANNLLKLKTENSRLITIRKAWIEGNNDR